MKSRGTVKDGKYIGGLILCIILTGIIIVGIRSGINRKWMEVMMQEINPEKIIRETVPALGGSQESLKELLGEQGRNLLAFFLQGDILEPETVLATEIPLAKAVKQSGVVQLTKEEEIVSPSMPESVEEEVPSFGEEIPEEYREPIREVDVSPKKNREGKVVLGNETSYLVDTEQLLQTAPSIAMKGDGPKVLIIHTHGTEAYAPEGSVFYDTRKNDRSENVEENVVKVGKALVEVFEKRGIETVHDTKLHDTPSFNGSYASSLKAMESYLKQYPSIQVILDVHRDSIVYEDGTKAKPVTEIQGEKAAQLMFVVGTDQKGLEHPNWQENIKSATHFQKAILKKYPTLMRHINLRRERFNGHTGKATMIIEAGSSGNSLSEAIYGVTLAGECIADYLLSLE